jgi:hypothetical protein
VSDPGLSGKIPSKAGDWQLQNRPEGESHSLEAKKPTLDDSFSCLQEKEEGSR